MSNEKKSLKGAALFVAFELYFAAAEYAFAIWDDSQASAPTLSANASKPLDAASVMSDIAGMSANLDEGNNVGSTNLSTTYRRCS